MTMKENEIDIFLAQETWLTWDFSMTINDIKFIYHCLQFYSSSRGECGVAIFLAPTAISAYENANEELPTTSSVQPEHISSGRFISLKLHFDRALKSRRGAYRKKKKNKISIPLIVYSVYYPYKCSDYDCMIEFMDDQLANINKSHHVLIS